MPATIKVTEYKSTSQLVQAVKWNDDVDDILDSINRVVSFMMRSYIDTLPTSSPEKRRLFRRHLIKTLEDDDLTVILSKTKMVAVCDDELIAAGTDQTLLATTTSGDGGGDGDDLTDASTPRRRRRRTYSRISSDDDSSHNQSSTVGGGGVGFSELSYRELRQLCKMICIKPQGTKQGLEDRLEKYRDRKDCTKSLDQEVDDDLYELFITISTNQTSKDVLMSTISKYVDEKKKTKGKKRKTVVDSSKGNKHQTTTTTPQLSPSFIVDSTDVESIETGSNAAVVAPRTMSYATKSVSDLKAMCKLNGLSLGGNKQALIDKLCSFDSQQQHDLQNVTTVVSTNYGTMNVSALKAMCKLKGLSVGGNKQALMEKLCSYDTQHNQGGDTSPPQEVGRRRRRCQTEDDDATEIKTIASPPPPPQLKKTKAKKTTRKGIGGGAKQKGRKIVEIARDEIKLTENEYGQKVHDETRLVFNDDIVIGFLDEEDHLRPLTTEKMDMCKEYKFKYEIPDDFDVEERLSDD